MAKRKRVKKKGLDRLLADRVKNSKQFSEYKSYFQNLLVLFRFYADFTLALRPNLTVFTRVFLVGISFITKTNIIIKRGQCTVKRQYSKFAPDRTCGYIILVPPLWRYYILYRNKQNNITSTYKICLWVKSPA